MGIRQSLTATALAFGIGALIIPALARALGGPESMMDQGTGQMGDGRRMAHSMMPGGMMPGGMMGAGMMSGGHAGMMQSMNGGNGRPNSQWRPRPPGDGARPD